VLSDTHARSLDDIPRKVIDALASGDMIIHAGDFTDIEVLAGLRKLGKLIAVQGNMDSGELKSILAIREILEVGNKRIGITHGSGSPWGIEDRVRKIFAGDRVDAIVYGHSHKSQNRVIDGILFFNPGKAEDSFGMLTVGEKVTGQIISSRG